MPSDAEAFARHFDADAFPCQGLDYQEASSGRTSSPLGIGAATRVTLSSSN